MASPVAHSFQLYLFFLALVCPLFVVEANLILHPSDLDALSTLWTRFSFITPQLHSSDSRNGNPCYEITGIHCEKRISTESPPVLRVTQIFFESRGLNGSLSPSIGRLLELKELSLSNNYLVDQIPSQIVDCQKLEILNLRNNLFSGKVSSVSSLVRLRSLDLSSNRFSGDLNFLRYLPNLENLSLADNFFYGRIPNSLRSFRSLQYLNLSGNNYLQGPVPTINQIGYFDSPRLKIKTRTISLPKRYILTENSSKSNHGIGGVAIAPSPSSTSKSKSSNAEAPSTFASPKHHTSERKLKSSITGFFCGAAAGLISWLTLSILFKLLSVCIRGRVKGSGPVIFSPLIKDAEALAFLEKEDGLSSLELIGKGGCGEVYKTELPGSNGKIIAIKKILQPQPHFQQPTATPELVDEDSKFLNKKLRQIRSEIKTVGQIRHRNLLPLLAHVTRSDCHLLVYEYMKNGSLQDVLHQVSQGTRELEWKVRHQIAIGIAAGLEYLHMHHSPRIIHRDLKPANILLDDEMEARIADFGLAKSIPDANTHVTTSNVAGTMGYIAPEYHQTLKFTDKCDVYSFGVMMAVLVMRKLPSDDFFQETDEMSLVKWLRKVLTSDDPTRAIDESLMGNGYEEQMLLVLKIACFCTVDNPKERPNSTDVRCMLSQVKP
ncbi:leucine-rich repeat receptor-like serine/threonine/tyrosine-protein kinase SOBIR1 [Telopea speciosissima]|uniref:leucine-rich repeat receptor-like serine/threonine/tyrosine-protein kinase SOBIR1 n=1 Tax=Telopea speciosissima TaxID=54955 RepID=UPI001CC6FD5B|nr:leucine-rich repeat receptor-like serine/threonine/tyrosine-protein kinase SOBIR1 [Telopea speciosissima]